VLNQPAPLKTGAEKQIKPNQTFKVQNYEIIIVDLN
jgi:hypothetical protein